MFVVGDVTTGRVLEIVGDDTFVRPIFFSFSAFNLTSSFFLLISMASICLSRIETIGGVVVSNGRLLLVDGRILLNFNV